MRRGHLSIAAAALLALPPAAHAQQACDPAGTRQIAVMNEVAYFQVARLRCSDMSVRADSATLYQESGVYHFFGRVVIDNPDVRLEAANAQYYADNGMIQAQGGVRIRRKEDGTSITGGENLVFFRAGVAGRTEDALTVEGGRPHAVMNPRAREGAEPDSAAAEPYEIDADRIEVRGQNDLTARGGVELHRGELNATGDEMLYVSASEQLRLDGSASLDVETYVLTGGLILVTMAEGEVSDILAREGAHLTGDIEIEAELIQLEMSGGELASVVARSDLPPVPAAGRGAGAGQPGIVLPQGGAGDTAPGRAAATSEDFRVTADRLDIDVTAGVLQQVDARGRARLVTTAGDSLNTADTPEIARSDWVEGDTINVFFVPADSAPQLAGDRAAVRPPDSAVARDPEVGPDSAAAQRPRLESLVARVNARALYRMPAADTTNAADPACAGPGRFAVHYVVGDSITITMRNDEVNEMTVIGQVHGQHWEPPACAAAPQDSIVTPAPPPPASTPPPGSAGTPVPPPPDSGSAPPFREEPARAAGGARQERARRRRERAPWA
jgi:lipopolysaccharide export system protein LptA